MLIKSTFRTFAGAARGAAGGATGGGPEETAAAAVAAGAVIDAAVALAGSWREHAVSKTRATVAIFVATVVRFMSGAFYGRIRKTLAPARSNAKSSDSAAISR
jgi:hypothetical protein